MSILKTFLNNRFFTLTFSYDLKKIPPNKFQMKKEMKRNQTIEDYMYICKVY